jgi:hypothetical protein
MQRPERGGKTGARHLQDARMRLFAEFFTVTSEVLGKVAAHLEAEEVDQAVTLVETLRGELKRLGPELTSGDD